MERILPETKTGHFDDVRHSQPRPSLLEQDWVGLWPGKASSCKGGQGGNRLCCQSWEKVLRQNTKSAGKG